MKVVVAIDSFKGCVSSRQAAQAARLGVIDAVKDAEVNTFEIADGGEGTMECLVSQLGGEKKECMVTGPLGEKIMSTYGIVNKNTAIIEMSAAAGITLVDKDKLNPLYATTYGVGELIINAMDRGCTKFIIGIGGNNSETPRTIVPVYPATSQTSYRPCDYSQELSNRSVGQLP